MKKYISVLLVLVLAMGVFAACGKKTDDNIETTTEPFVSEKLSDGDFDYETMPDGTAKVTAYKYNPGKGELHIPEAIGTVAVTVIADSAFENATNIREVYLPKTIKSIGNKAFKGSSLTRIITTSCNALTSIGDEAFADCKGLIQADISASVTSVGKNAFANDEAIVSLVFRGKAPLKLSEDMFTGAKIRTIFTDYEIKEIKAFAEKMGYGYKVNG